MYFKDGSFQGIPKPTYGENVCICVKYITFVVDCSFTARECSGYSNGALVVEFVSLCRYRKRTDIYYSTWSFENVAKICQF